MSGLAIPQAVHEPLLVCGDSLELMRQLPAESIDAVVDDPPAGIGFMGKAWDSFAKYEPPDRHSQVRLDTMRLLGLAPWQAGFVAFMADCHIEALRVLKPGAYMVTWALPRTQDLAGLALRLAGFDVVHAGVHLFGGGMKKGGDVSKGLDKMAGAEREVVGTSSTCTGPSQREGTFTANPDASTASLPITAPSTDAAKRWDGYHTQLAPGHEIWHVSRKPTPLTYARNVLEHGCGALHIDACRVPRGEADREAMRVPQPAIGVNDTNPHGCGEGRNGDTFEPPSGGSWPRDVLLSRGGDQCPVEGIDRQSGVTGQTRNVTSFAAEPAYSGTTFGTIGTGSTGQLHGDTGGASRYFTQFDQRAYYGPKNHDRRSGLLHGDHKHPTPKHIDLMRWLQRLVVPTAKATGGLPGVVLSRFLGSGTDGVAAVAEGFRFVGFELDPGHFEVARSKIMAAIGSPEEAARANEQAPTNAQLGLL